MWRALGSPCRFAKGGAEPQSHGLAQAEAKASCDFIVVVAVDFYQKTNDDVLKISDDAQKTKDDVQKTNEAQTTNDESR